MEQRITLNYERGLTTAVNDIEHIESQSLPGIAVIKIFFQPGANIDARSPGHRDLADRAALAAARHHAAASSCATARRPCRSCSSRSRQRNLTEQQLYDFGNNFIRTQLATVQGAQCRLPYGGKQRQIMVDIDSRKLQREGPRRRPTSSTRSPRRT